MSDSSEPELTFTLPQARMATVEGRLGLSLPIGLEGAGTVIAAGPQAKALEGRVVATMRGGMFAEFRTGSALDVILHADGRSAADGASIGKAMTAPGQEVTASHEGQQENITTDAAPNTGQQMKTR